MSEVERPADPDHRERRLDSEEEKRLLERVCVTERIGGQFTGPQNIYLKPMVEFAIETGMRLSEMLAIEWQFVDIDGRIVHIPKSKIDKGKDAPVSRDVPLSSKAIAILKSLPQSPDGTIKVFKTTDDAIKKAYKRAVERARLRYLEDCQAEGKIALARMLVDLHFHDLRHEATSRLAKIYDIRELAKIGGWKDINTLARYYNPTPKELVDKMIKHESSL